MIKGIWKKFCKRFQSNKISLSKLSVLQFILLIAAIFTLKSYMTGFLEKPSIVIAQNAPYQSFNHDTTTFPLLGAHRGLECAKCHIAGRYRGTPRFCNGCHNNQITYGQPQGHIMTAQDCIFCHTQNAWLPVHFLHDANTLSTPCSTCHNGVLATGKPANHIVTTLDCGSCHTTTTFAGASFNHANIGVQACSSCHKAGSAGIGPKNDLVHNNLNGNDCKSCHASTTTFTIWTMNHTGISPPTACMTCHVSGNNIGAVSKPAGHPVTTQDCGACHSTTTFSK